LFDGLLEEQIVIDYDSYRFLRALVCTPSTASTVFTDYRLSLFYTYGTDETDLCACSASCALLGHGDLNTRHSFYFSADLWVKVRQHLPKTAAITAITDRQQLSIGADP
jgi:hypothetical protein